jgi:hypothetical protein
MIASNHNKNEETRVKLMVSTKIIVKYIKINGHNRNKKTRVTLMFLKKLYKETC